MNPAVPEAVESSTVNSVAGATGLDSLAGVQPLTGTYQFDTDASPQVRAAISNALSEPIRELSRLTLWKGLAGLVLDWTIIVAAFAVALSFPQWVVWVVAAVVIATRQHALLILMHDASHHRLLHYRKWNDRLSNWFLAWPVLVTTEGYRANHLPHHFYLNSDNDPDWVRKAGKPDWEFPKTRLGVARLLIREFFGGGFIEAVKSIVSLAGPREKMSERKCPHWGRWLYYAAIAGASIATGLWPAVLLLWFLPAFTLLPVILRLRSIAEHFGLEAEHELNMSRNIHVGLWERILFAPHHCGYHLDHHLFPSVPFYNLPRLHRVLCEHPEYAAHAHQTTGMFIGPQSTVLAEISTRR